MRRAVLCLVLSLAFTIGSDVLDGAQLNKWTALNLGLSALKAKYPQEYRDLVIKYRPFVAKFEGGIWSVHGTTGIFLLGGGAPTIEIRDRDQKVLKIILRDKRNL